MKRNWIKTFAIIVGVGVVLFVLLTVATSLIKSNTDIDTGNTIFNILFYIVYGVFSVGVVGLIAAFVQRVIFGD